MRWAEIGPRPALTTLCGRSPSQYRRIDTTAMCQALDVGLRRTRLLALHESREDSGEVAGGERAHIEA